MRRDSQFQPRGEFLFDQQQPKNSNCLLWLLGGFATLVVLFCGVGLVGIVYLGFNAPKTSVYVGNRVPNKYVNRAQETGAIEKGEKIKFFYSDGIMDVRESFVLATDSKICVHIEDGREVPLQIIEFPEIESAELDRDESFINDSEITVELKNGEHVSFPVSSEFNRDEDFFAHIQKHIN